MRKTVLIVIMLLAGCQDNTSKLHDQDDDSMLHITKTSHKPATASHPAYFVVEAHTSSTNYRLTCEEDRRNPPCFYVIAGDTHQIESIVSNKDLLLIGQPGTTQSYHIEESSSR